MEGDEDHLEELQEPMKNNGFKTITPVNDLTGRMRFLKAIKE